MLNDYKKIFFIKYLQNGNIGSDEFDKFFFCFNIIQYENISNIRMWFLESLLEEIAARKIGLKKSLILLNEFIEEKENV